MKTGFKIAAALAALVYSGATAQAEDYADYGTARGWAVQAVSMDGSFLRCEAMEESTVFMLTLSNEGWMVTIDALPGTPAEAVGMIDIDRASFPATFYPLSDGRYGAFLDGGMAEAIREGSHTVLEVGGQITEGPLTGSAAAMGKLEECVQNGGVAGATAATAPGAVDSDADRMDATCPDPRQFASPESHEMARIEFANRSDIAISIYWIDFAGQLVEYAATLPGESVTLDSYVGHAWLAKDFNGTCHGGVLAVTAANPRYELF